MSKCHSVECKSEADFVVMWPGEPEPLKMCEPCAKLAQKVGETIGCPIIIMPMVEVTQTEDKEYRD